MCNLKLFHVNHTLPNQHCWLWNSKCQAGYNKSNVIQYSENSMPYLWIRHISRLILKSFVLWLFKVRSLDPGLLSRWHRIQFSKKLGRRKPRKILLLNQSRKVFRASHRSLLLWTDQSLFLEILGNMAICLLKLWTRLWRHLKLNISNQTVSSTWRNSQDKNYWKRKELLRWSKYFHHF